MVKEKVLSDLFHDTLRDVYYVGKQIPRSLPRMAKATTSDKLKQAFEKHREETEEQVE